MKVVLLGGTSGMGRALARSLVERGDQVFLLGRRPEELARSAADLEVRHPHKLPCGHALCDLENPEEFEPALDAAEATLGGLDAVIVTAALFATQDTLESDLTLTRRLLTVNFTNTILFCEHARRRLLARGGGHLVVFSSVAGDRGRKPVVLYGSSKAGLSAYLEGLDHRFHGQGLRVLCVKPGFVKTGMTAGLKPPPFAGEPAQVARDVLRAMDRGSPLIYTPSIWSLILCIIRALPRFVMRRIQF
ncbi:MAG: SDR family NAD(P)-dependent oxidoreductase [Myxococcales bacterium]|nr:SDR family NAD(P)-dependent oxidoreductase [Polyangiaceae bacterium]MDW8248048.1 SDR family NAD(P)-dependent oxidoreductase [Myxococcales bacterium]